MRLLKNIVKKIIPPKNSFIYSAARWYINIYNSDNNCDYFSNGEYEVLKKFIPRSKLVFDVGSNKGEWSRLALQINPKIQLHCFEPSKYTFDKLRAELNGKAKLNNFGLSSKKCKRKLYIFDNGSGINSLYKRYGLENIGLETQKRMETISLDTLNNYCHNSIYEIDFLKIDVEGHELEVLKGADKLIKNGKIKIIQFEYGGCNIDSRVLLKDIFTFFKDLDYNFHKIYPKEIIKLDYKQELENYQYQNWIIARKDISI